MSTAKKKIIEPFPLKDLSNVWKKTKASLRRIGKQSDEKINVARGALLLSRLNQPYKEVQPYLDHLKDIHQAVKDKLKKYKIKNPELDQRVNILNEVILEDFGYVGDHDHYEGHHPFDLMSTIDQRKGVPITLAIIYMDVARRMQWPMSAINFPGHFLLRISCFDRACIVDPFHGGKCHDAVRLRGLIKIASGLDAELQPGDYAPTDNRNILLKLQNNNKLRYIKNGDMASASDIVDTMLWVAPLASNVWYEGALLQARKGCFQKAKSMLEKSLDCAESEEDRHQIYLMLQQLRQRIQ